MKGTIELLLSIIACFVTLIAITSAAPEGNGRDCPVVCPANFNPVCGYDGACYQQFGNQCQYDHAKCTRKTNLETVDRSLCDLAAKDNHPNYKICPNANARK